MTNSKDKSLAQEADLLQSYVYQPLLSADTVRILSLEPAATESEPLRGSLIHVQRHEELAKPDSQCEYAAISYPWGEPEFTQRIWLKSPSPQRVEHYCSLRVTNGMQAMLRGLRKSSKTRNLWVDAISLDQGDEAEKAQQIPLIGEVYSQAHKVIMWLEYEEDDNDVGRVFAFFRLLASSTVSNNEAVLRVFGDKNVAQTSLKAFFQRRFFFRRWILQETAAAYAAHNGILQCGRYTIPYSRFVAACQRLRDTRYGRTRYAVQMTITMSSSKDDIFALLWNLHRSECSDKRDRVAALSAFLPRKVQLQLDYQNSYADIYKQHAINLVNSDYQHYLIRHLFSFGALEFTGNTSFPSWIPDWSRSRLGKESSLCLQHPPSYQRSREAPIGVSAFLNWCQSRVSDERDKKGSNDCHYFSIRTYLDPRYNWDFLAPCTFFSTRTNANNQCLLNVSWLNPWGEEYGRLVTKVVKIPEEAHTIDPRTVASWFLPLVKSPKNGIPAHLRRKLGLLLQRLTTTSRDASAPPSRWWAGAEEVSSALHELHDAIKSPASKLPRWNIITDVVGALKASQLAIAELQGSSDCSYALCPQNTEVGMRLLPLASQNEPSLSELLETTAAQTDARARILWWTDLPHEGILHSDDLALTNMIAVQPCEMNQDTTMKYDGEDVPPLQARYVGPCVGLVDARTKEWGGFGKQILGEFTAVCRRAKERGRPPPFTMDIV